MQDVGVVVPEPFMGHPVRNPENPQVFLEVEIASGASKRAKGRIVFELFADVTPKTVRPSLFVSNFEVGC